MILFIGDVVLVFFDDGIGWFRLSGLYIRRRVNSSKSSRFGVYSDVWV